MAGKGLNPVLASQQDRSVEDRASRKHMLDGKSFGMGR